MKTISPQKTLWLSGTALITLFIVLVSIWSLKNGYTDIFMYFYVLPVILLAFFYPRHAVYVTVVLGWIFIGIVYLYGPADIRLYAASSAWFYIFVSIGIVLSAFSGQLQQERRYHEIVENSQAGIFTVDLEKRAVTGCNDRMAAMLGYSRKESESLAFDDLWFAVEQQGLFEKSIRSQGKVADMEAGFKKKDRTVIWLLVTAALTGEGTVVCSAVDITERKRIRDELIESEIRYRTLFDGASDAIFIHDVDGRIFETNLIATGQLGYTKREFMQMQLQDLDERGDAMFRQETIQRLVSRGHLLYETLFRKKDGTRIPVEISSRTTEYFGMPAIISIVRDISERKNAGEQNPPLP